MGKASVLPLVGAPDGPLFTYCPFNELINDNFSLYEELMWDVNDDLQFSIENGKIVITNLNLKKE